MRKIYILLIVLFAVFPAPFFAQAQNESTFFYNNREIVLHQNMQDLIGKLNTSGSAEKPALVYLKFKRTVNKASLLSNGIQLQSSPAAGIYLATVSGKIDKQFMDKNGIESWADVHATDKISPLLTDISASTGNQKILLAVPEKISLTQIQRYLEPFSGKLLPEQLWKDQHIWEVNIPADKIAALAAEDFVLAIMPVIKPQTLLFEANGLVNASIAHQPVIVGGYDLHGDSVSIGVGDNSDPLHIDYADRILAFNPSYGNDHAFHTTGTVGGNGIVDEKFKGFANKSRIVSDFFSQVISNTPNFLHDFNMVITNNSYGNIVGDCNYAGTYDIYSQYTDQQLMDNPTVLHVFAAANDGKKNCSPFPAGFATITGSFSTAKNVLTVGGTDKAQEPVYALSYSSKGPVKDGRLKPEISAMGTLLVATIENNTYGVNGGTSMATPNVAGSAGLLYQRYRQLHGNQDPKGSLIKTILMNGATDMPPAGPDFKFGFGQLNVGHSLIMLDSNRYFFDTTNTNVTKTYTINIPANTAKAKIMLYWNDPAAAPLSATTLINDLDLTVTDPSNNIKLPLVLDPSPSQVQTPAAPGVDHRNNVEQVTIDNPVAGNYTIKVKGFNVPEIDQEYVVAYDFTPVGISMHYPFGGESLVAGDSMMVYWEASDDANTFTLSFSQDNGANWQVINNNIAADRRYYTWTPAASVNASQCLIRVSRNNTTQASQSKTFTLTGRPVVTLNPTNEQCPGAIKISWNAIPGISQYRIFKKSGFDMVPVTTVTGTTYTFTGLNTDSTYWVAVAGILNGTISMRSVAVSRMPANGNCVGTVNHGDLRMAKALAPNTGRILTNTALSASQPLTILINNLDDQVANNYRISYKVNNGAWNSNNYTDPVNPGGSRQITVANLNLAAVGTYNITVAVTNLAMTDPLHANDTLTYEVQQIDNPAMDLSTDYAEGFEGTQDVSLVGISKTGLAGLPKWDFTQSQPYGRLKNFLSSSVTISGSRSMSMDNNRNQRTDIAGSSYNTLTGTFNLSNYNTAGTELRCEFDYVMSGLPKFDTGNSVWVRGSDADPWIHLLDYQIDTVNYGAVFHSGSIQLSDILAAAGQSFTTSTQIRFTQYDTSRIESSYYGNGVTIDNFSLYLVTDDISMVSLDSIYHYNCGLSAQVPLKVRVGNEVNNTVHNIQVSYKLDNNPVVTEMIDSIQGNDTIVYTFMQPMDLSANTTYQLSTWVNAMTDTYRVNDSIINFGIKNQPVITTFPYLETFEQNEGFYYSDGNNNSWQYGTPASAKINHAASGTKAWKTHLAGNYNANEVSYLYSPCFDISQMTKPTLSFNMAADIEAPGQTIFDKAYVEYSHDGNTWIKLGAANQGTNWYGNDSAQAWTNRNETYWHVATIPLPNDQPIVSFRFVLRSDQGTEYDGLAIDDIHVYDLVHPIFNQEQFPQTITQTIAANQNADFISGNDIGASILNGSSALGLTKVQDYKHVDFVNNDSTQYFLPKNFVVQPANAPGDSVTMRFYVPDQAMKTIREDLLCPSCNKVSEVQGLGITKYSDPDLTKENNTLADNVAGTYTFIPKDKIRWIPYDIGYYAEVKVKSFSEFWFNDGGPTHDQTLDANIFDFTASHYGDRYAQLQWSSNIDDRTATYELQRAGRDMNFTTIATINAAHQNGITYSYIDTVKLDSAVVYYRVKYTMQDASAHWSVIRSLDWSGFDGIVNVYPNPVRNGLLYLDWFKGNGDGIQWRLLSITGRSVKKGDINDPAYSGKYVLNLDEMALANGIYILEVRSGKEKWAFKIVYQ